VNTVTLTLTTRSPSEEPTLVVTTDGGGTLSFYNYSKGEDILKNLTNMANYLTYYCAKELHLHFSYETEGFSFGMGVLAIVLGLPEEWVYSGTCDPAADWLPVFGTEFAHLA